MAKQDQTKNKSEGNKQGNTRIDRQVIIEKQERVKPWPDPKPENNKKKNS